jgi:pyruvate/2-oxoglutarate dehydrogenase complex dihydrolipoamide dehydrogenase (E3) component
VWLAGARVLLVAEGEIGGECTFTGCVPSKTLIEAAARGTAFPAAMAAVRHAVAAIAATETPDVLGREGIEVLGGRAVFISPREVSVDGRGLRAWAFVVATGSRPTVPPVPGSRRPVTGDLGMEAAGVHVDKRGCIVTDRHLATTARGIYAAGDVTGRMPFTHAAFAMGRLAARNALRPRWSPPGTFKTAAIPWVVFTDPEVAQVGLTEAEAATHAGARVAWLPVREADRAVTAGRTEGFVKIIAGRRGVLGSAGGGRVLRATIVAARAGEMIHEPALAMRTGMFTGRLAQVTHAYPTWSLAIQQAAAQFFGEFGGRTARNARA